MSVLVRELSHNKITAAEAVKGFFKEILLGIIDGAVNGVVTGVAVYFIYGNFYLGVIVLVAMIGNMIVAGVFGFLVPLVLDKIHADPAVASSIFVTTATDVLGLRRSSCRCSCDGCPGMQCYASRFSCIFRETGL